MSECCSMEMLDNFTSKIDRRIETIKAYKECNDKYLALECFFIGLDVKLLSHYDIDLSFQYANEICKILNP